MLGEVSRTINNIGTDIQSLGLSPHDLAELIMLVHKGTISLNMAKETVFPTMLAEHRRPGDIVTQLGLNQISDHNQLEVMILNVIDSNPEQLKKYLDGKENIKDFFVGQVMKKGMGKVNPSVVKEILEQVLKIKKSKA
jgi:aspartyl-tRNA(Asn)/glutamyl-tRNA(Gln) amidotransferase subunit B